MPSLLRQLLGATRRKRCTLIQFTGHRILADPKTSRFPARREKDIAAAIARVVDREGVIAGYGGLASGSDILVAEALLKVGAELHVILPCSDEDYIETSVAEAGQDWVKRFEVLREKATSVIETAEGTSAIAFGKASDLAMRKVQDAAIAKGLKHFQLALFDGVVDDGPAGAAADIKRARDMGWCQVILRLKRRGRIREI